MSTLTFPSIREFLVAAGHLLMAVAVSVAIARVKRGKGCGGQTTAEPMAKFKRDELDLAAQHWARAKALWQNSSSRGKEGQ